MQTIRQLIYFFVTLAIFFNAIQVYLMVNQLWKQKHIREVSLSISFGGSALAFFTTIIWGVYFLLEKQWFTIVNQVLWIILFLFQLFVAAGFWVKEERNKGIYQMIKDRLR